MSELKTLKDLKEKHGIFGPDYVGLKEIKAEAMKWIKHFNDDLKSAYTKEWIKCFFDLNEEDLKQQLEKKKR